jgi:putative Mn2+ efflux pump MntP
MVALLLVAVSLGVDNFAGAIAIGTSGVDARTRLRVGLVFGAFEAGMPLIGLVIGAQAAGLLGHAARWTGAGLLIAAGGYAILAEARKQAASRGSGSRADGGAEPDQPGDAAALRGEPDSRGGGSRADGRAEPDEPRDAAALRGEPDSRGSGSRADGGAEPDQPGDAAALRGGPGSRGGTNSPPATGRLLVTGLALSLDNLVVGFALGASHVSVVVGAVVIGVVSAALSLAGLEVGARAGKWAGERSEQLAGLLLIFVGIALGTGLLG